MGAEPPHYLIFLTVGIIGVGEGGDGVGAASLPLPLQRNLRHPPGRKGTGQNALPTEFKHFKHLNHI